MDGPANTQAYFIAGYIVIFGSMLFYFISLIVRWRNLRQEETLLQEMHQSDSADQY